MSDFQPIYDVVRQTSEVVQGVVYEYSRPSILYRPTLKLDGNGWIAMLGENLQEGVVGTGRSPEEAMRDFDLSWHKKQPAMIPAAQPERRMNDE